MLDTLGRALPGQFANYAMASIIINTFNSGKPKRLYELLNENRYTIRRTGKIRFYDSSRRKVGCQSLGNRIDDIVKNSVINAVYLRPKTKLEYTLKNFTFNNIYLSDIYLPPTFIFDQMFNIRN